MSNEVIFNQSYTLYEQILKMLRLLEIILLYVHSKMVAMETIIIYPDSIFRYIGELQFIILYGALYGRDIHNMVHYMEGHATGLY